eukprot:jgi/Astpho2/1118/gw1.00020.27.1_t
MVAVLASGTSLTDGLKLELYGLYKQAMCGPCCSGKPAFWDRKGRAKWSAWDKLGNLSPEAAREQYVATVRRAVPEWRSQDDAEERAQRPKAGQPMGPVMSSLAHNTDAAGGTASDVGSLHTLASEGALEPLRRCLAAGADVNERDAEGCTALHWAADRGHLQAAEALCEAGADVNARDGDGQTPLHYAALCEQQAMCRFLLGHEAKASCQDSSGQTAQDLAPGSWT